MQIVAFFLFQGQCVFLLATWFWWPFFVRASDIPTTLGECGTMQLSMEWCAKIYRIAVTKTRVHTPI